MSNDGIVSAGRDALTTGALSAEKKLAEDKLLLGAGLY